jgi:uncharacterized protein (DUF849 family)
MLAGATAIHLHVRDSSGDHTLDADAYRRAIDAIREATEGRMVIQITTEACGIFSPEQQMAAVRDVRPEAASVAIRELIPPGSQLGNVARFFEWAYEHGVGLQFVIYDHADLLHAVFLTESGVIPNAFPHVLLVLGRYSKAQRSDPRDLAGLLRVLPAKWPWTLCAFGAEELQCMEAAIAAGGNCRVGFENNLQRPDGQTARCNAELVQGIRQSISQSPRPLGSIHDARTLYLG